MKKVISILLVSLGISILVVSFLLLRLSHLDGSKETFVYKGKDFLAEYATGWSASDKSNCYEYLDSEHQCTIFSKDQYSLIFVREDLQFSESDFLSEGLLSKDDLDNSIAIDVGGIEVLRYKYLNGNDEEGSILSGVWFLKSIEDISAKYVGKQAQSRRVGDYYFTIIYMATPGTLKSNNEFNNSPYILEMDEILRSIKWTYL